MNQLMILNASRTETVSFEMTPAATEYLQKRGLIMHFGEADEFMLIAGAKFDDRDVHVLLNMADYGTEESAS